MNNTNQQPLVSVILPVYNASNFLEDSISSILNQTYSNFELIIINDASTDDSHIVISSFNDSRIKYYQNTHNLKLIQTLNKGITLAKGKYIARMDADDICFSYRLEKQVYFLENNPEYILVGSQVQLIDEVGKENGTLAYFSEHEDIVFASLFYCPIIHPSVIIRSSILEEQELLFDESYIHAEDYELWTRMFFFGKFKNLDTILLKYRIHKNQISNVYKIDQININRVIQFQLASRIFTNLKDLEIEYLLEHSDLSVFIERIEILDKSFDNLIMNSKLLSSYLKKRIKNELLNVSSLSLAEFITLHIKYLNYLFYLNPRQYFALLCKSLIL